MLWDQVKQKLEQDVRDRRLAATARDLGWAYTKLHRLASGYTPHPRVDTVERLASYYSDRQANKQ